MSSVSELVSVIGYALVVGALVVGYLKILMFVRAKQMRAFAAQRGFQYIGPPTLGFWKVWVSYSRKVKLPFPASFSLRGYPIDEIRQVWNVIEGQQSGVLLLIFDSFVRGGKAGWYCTFIAYQTQRNPFGTHTSRNCVVQRDGWTLCYRIPFLKTPWPWTMGINRLDDYVNKLQVGSVREPSW